MCWPAPRACDHCKVREESQAVGIAAGQDRTAGVVQVAVKVRQEGGAVIRPAENGEDDDHRSQAEHEQRHHTLERSAETRGGDDVAHRARSNSIDDESDATWR